MNTEKNTKIIITELLSHNIEQVEELLKEMKEAKRVITEDEEYKGFDNKTISYLLGSFKRFKPMAENITYTLDLTFKVSENKYRQR